MTDTAMAFVNMLETLDGKKKMKIELGMPGETLTIDDVLSYGFSDDRIMIVWQKKNKNEKIRTFINKDFYIYFHVIETTECGSGSDGEAEEK